jgi:hypothetical protein
VNLDDMHETVQARRQRRLAVAVAVLGAGAAIAVVLVGSGFLPDRSAGAAAGPAPTASATATVGTEAAGRRPVELYDDVAAALDDRGLVLEQPLRWGSSNGSLFAGRVPGAPDAGVHATGLDGHGYLPALGAELTVATFRLEQPVPADADFCSWPEIAPTAGQCAQGRAADGITVTVQALHLGVTSAAWLGGRQVVVVSSHTTALPAASDVKDPHPVDADRLRQLAQDPRLRW